MYVEIVYEFPGALKIWSSLDNLWGEEPTVNFLPLSTTLCPSYYSWILRVLSQ